VPKLTKSAKTRRDTGAIALARANLAGDATIIVYGEEFTPEGLAGLFQQHLDALERVRALTLQRAEAVAIERRLEARVAAVHRGLASQAKVYFGKSSPQLRRFAIAPEKTPHMTAETKKRANEKRQATRKQRGIMGKRQRAAWNKKRRSGG
jgi:hypothetical protein